MSTDHAPLSRTVLLGESVKEEPQTEFEQVVEVQVGLHSTTRHLTFGPEIDFIRHLGTYLSVFSEENFLGLVDWQVWVDDAGTGGAVMTVRDNSELRVYLGFHADPIAFDHRDVEGQKRIIADRVSDLGWEVPELVRRMWTSEDFYFDSMAQITMDSWSTGRVALVGDAAHCASPLSGQGTSIALVGAYVLACEPGRTDDHASAFARYESRMRPFVTANQELALLNQSDIDPERMATRTNAVKNSVDVDAAASV